MIKTVGITAGVIASGTILAGSAHAAPAVAERGSQYGQHRPSATHNGAGPMVGPSAPSAEVLALFGPIAAGTRIGRWQVRAVHAVKMGSIPVVLATEDGREFQVNVLRRDRAPSAPAPVGQSPSLSVFVSNRGDGSTATEEEQGLGAMALCDALSEREAAGVTLPALLTLRERNARFPLGVHRVLV